MDKAERLINLDEAAELLGFSKSKMYRDLTSGRITSIRIGSRGQHKFQASKLLEEVCGTKQEK